MGIDIGLNTLAAVTSNQPGVMPFLVQGRPVKAINQWYNKRRAQLQAKLPEGVYASRQLDILTDKRARQITCLSARRQSPYRVVAGGAAHRYVGHWQE